MRIPRLVRHGRRLALLAAGVCCVATGRLPRPLRAQPPGSLPNLPAVNAPGGSGGAPRDGHRSVAAGDDFFTYANAAWLRTATFPPGYATVGAFEEVQLRTEQRVHALIREAVAAAAPPGDPRQQIGALYASYVDTARLEALGVSPIREELRQTLALATHADVARRMADRGSSSVVAAGVAVDAGDPRRALLIVANVDGGQPMLGLPAPDFYARRDGPYPGHRAAYRAYVAATLARAGVSDAERRAADVLALETRIAARRWSPARVNDRRANYRLMRRAELVAFAPGFPWDAFLAERQVGDVRELVLATDSAVRALAQLFGETPVDAWRSYLAFHWVQNHVDFLPAAFRQASFAFYDRRLRGVREASARARRAPGFVSERLGQLVGRRYVERHLPPEARARADTMVGYLRRAFAARLARADWMDDATRAEARAKLAGLVVKIGSPDVWRDYAGVAIDPADLMGNVRRLRTADWAYARARLGIPVRRTDWNQTPQTVDASAAATLNAIEFPAGILQPPFFDPAADAAANFGAIGAVIGHEMGHGFDDQGSRFDSRGRLRDWWTAATRRRFDERTAALAAQYDAYEPLPGARVNGRQTLPENVADLTGLAVAHEAYRQYVRDRPSPQGRAAPVLGGLTGEQRFFLAYGQAFRVRHTDEALRAKLQGDSHAPGMVRVNGVVRNLDPWYAAFGVTAAHRLYLAPERRVTVW